MNAPHDMSASTTLAFSKVGHDLQRPECVLATAGGRLYASDKRGGVTVIEPDGRQHRIGCDPRLIPNGIALQPDGSFLVANLGEDGGVWHLDRQGQARPWLMEFEGQALPRVNFVTTDRHGTTWACISALHTGDDYPLDDTSGFILRCDARGVRLAADGLRYTNEVRLTADGRHAYVNETFGRRLSRLRVTAEGLLADRTTFAEFDAGDFPDGLTLDAEGGAWVVCVGSNRVYRVDAQGRRHTVIDDADLACVERLELAFTRRELTRPMLAGARGRQLCNITSLAFSGPGLRTAYMGSLDADHLVRFESPIAGLRPDHWDWG